MIRSKRRQRKATPAARDRVLADDLRRYRAFDSLEARLKGLNELLTKYERAQSEMMVVMVRAMAPTSMNDAERSEYAEATVRDLNARAVRVVRARRALSGEDQEILSAHVRDFVEQRPWSKN